MCLGTANSGLAGRPPAPDPARRDRPRAPGSGGGGGAAHLGARVAAAGTAHPEHGGGFQPGGSPCRPAATASSRRRRRGGCHARGFGRRWRPRHRRGWRNRWPTCCGASARRRAMLTGRDEAMERVSTAHRAKLAYIYVRQSSAGQVRQHQESTELQYRLVDRAAGLGWPRERIEVIDDDLGKSGASGVERHGFQRLIAEIGLGKAGLVLSLDASRLARNNRDWHQLLELCSMFGVVIGDGERLYDPGAYHDRLLLGLSGIMSEAELHQIRMRLHQGERQKAARGELRLPLPAGLAYDRSGAIILNPDEEVQARLRLVFAKFRELQSARAVMRYLRANGLPLPVRPLLGPAPHEIVWREADSPRVRNILQNPSYAGAYVYGRRRPDPC